MILWRISKHSTLDGRGGLFAGARWHSHGRPMVYLAESPAGALLEVLVHLELSPNAYPSHYGLLKVEAPTSISVRTHDVSAMSPNWLKTLIATRTIGDEWLASKSSAMLRVPSAIVPETFNMLLNPEHPDAAKVRILWHEEYPWDARLSSESAKDPSRNKVEQTWGFRINHRDTEGTEKLPNNRTIVRVYFLATTYRRLRAVESVPNGCRPDRSRCL